MKDLLKLITCMFLLMLFIDKAVAAEDNQSTLTVTWDWATTSADGEPMDLTKLLTDIYATVDGVDIDRLETASYPTDVFVTLPFPEGAVVCLRASHRYTFANIESSFSDPICTTIEMPEAEISAPGIPTIRVRLTNRIKVTIETK